jgi:hypothetical protein
MKTFDIESELVKNIGELAQKSFLIKKINRHIETGLLDGHIGPSCWDTSSEVNSRDIRTVSTMNRYYAFPYRSEEFITRFWFTTLGEFIRDIPFSSDDDTFIFIRGIFFGFLLLLSFCSFFFNSFSEETFDGDIIYRF